MRVQTKTRPPWALKNPPKADQKPNQSPPKVRLQLVAAARGLLVAVAQAVDAKRGLQL